MSKRNDFTNLLVSKRLHHIHACRLPCRDERGNHAENQADSDGQQHAGKREGIDHRVAEGSHSLHGEIVQIHAGNQAEGRADGGQDDGADLGAGGAHCPQHPDLARAFDDANGQRVEHVDQRRGGQENQHHVHAVESGVERRLFSL